MRALRSPIILIVILLIAAAVLAGCGGDGSGGGEPTTYQNAVYGFEITYEDPLSQMNLDPTGDEAYVVAFVDKDGPQVEDEYAHGVRVSVTELSQSIKAKDVPRLQAEIAEVIEGMVTATEGGELISKVELTEVNGTPGYTVDYRYTMGGEQLTCRLTILIKGKYEFDLTEQALTSEWDSTQASLDAVVQSFTLD